MPEVNFIPPARYYEFGYRYNYGNQMKPGTNPSGLPGLKIREAFCYVLGMGEGELETGLLFSQKIAQVLMEVDQRAHSLRIILYILRESLTLQDLFGFSRIFQ
jgi:hypothetical protein